jgi:nucleotide-binding universal stress UspA family protein
MESMPVVLGVEDKQPSAVRFAAEAALMRDAELRIVHCPETLGDLSLWPDAAEDPLEAFPAPGQAVLDAAKELIDSMESPPRTKYVFGVGAPFDTLEAEARQASLVVVGTDSIGRMERLFDGTVTERLAHHAPVPVAIVPEVSWPAGSRSGVVLALDAREMVPGPIRFAFEEAARRNADVHVVHVAPAGMTASETKVLRAQIAETLAGWPQRYPDVHLTRRVTHGSADDECLRQGDEAAVLIVGRGSDPPSHPVLTQLARRAHGPCVVVPDAFCGV